MRELVSVNNLSKRFEGREVLTEIGLTVNAGDSIAFTGHNGSGKSTLLKLIAGLIPCDKGSIVRKKGLRIAYIPEHFPKLPITARDYLLHMGRLDGLSEQEIQRQLAALAKKFYMEDMLDTPIRFLSKGTIQKVCVMQALFGNPQLLLLDEPLSGQDRESQMQFIELIKEKIANGVAVVMSCHETYLLEEIAKKVYTIEHQQLHKIDFEPKQVKYKRIYFTKERDKVEREPNFIERRDEKNQTMILVEEQDLSCAVRKMLLENYELRGIEDEKM